MATAKTRTAPPKEVSVVIAHSAPPAALAQAEQGAAAHAALDELFVALKPFGACESPLIVALFHKIKSAI